jgi:hypothetical protein
MLILSQTGDEGHDELQITVLPTLDHSGWMCPRRGQVRTRRRTGDFDEPLGAAAGRADGLPERRARTLALPGRTERAGLGRHSDDFYRFSRYGIDGRRSSGLRKRNDDYLYSTGLTEGSVKASDSPYNHPRAEHESRRTALRHRNTTCSDMNGSGRGGRQEDRADGTSASA